MSDQKELDALRHQANSLGLKYHHRAGAATIKKLIDAHLAKSPEPVESVEAEDDNTVLEFPSVPGRTPEQEARLAKKVIPLTREEYHQRHQKEEKKKVAQLMRVRIQNMNPTKKDWPGEIISVGSAKLGTFKKYIPFNGEPYHIPKIIYDVLKEKKCSVFYNHIDDRGRKVRKSRLIDEYAIEILPALTKEELKDLSRKQQMAAGHSPMD